MMKYKRLKDVANIILPKISEVYTTSRRNVLPVINMQYIRNDAPDRYASDGVLVEDGDLLMVMDGYNAGEVLFAKKGYLGNSLSLIKPKKENDKDYLFLCLKKKENYIRAVSKSDYINHVSVSLLEKLMINIPSYEEQLEIKNEEFNKYNDLEIAKKEANKVRDRLNILVQQKVKILLDNERVYRIKDLVKTETGVTPKEVSEKDEDAIPFVTARNIKDKEYPVDINFYVSLNSYLKKCKENEVLITCVGSDIGNACITNKEYAFSQNLIRVFGAQRETLRLIYYYILTHDLTSFQKSSAIGFLSSQSLKNILVSLPESSQRKESLEEIEHIFEKKALIEKEIKNIEALLEESKHSLVNETIL